MAGIGSSAIAQSTPAPPREPAHHAVRLSRCETSRSWAPSREPPPRDAARGRAGRNHGRVRGAPARARVRGGVRHGRGGRPLRRDRGRTLRGGLRRHGNPDLRSDGADGHRHGDRHCGPRGQPLRSVDGDRAGRAAAGPSRCVEARSFRGLHPVRGRRGLPVRHRRPRHGDSGPSLPWSRPRARRRGGHAPRAAGGGEPGQRERGGDRVHDPCHFGLLAAPLRPVPARRARGPRPRHAPRRAVAERRAGRRGGAGRPADAAARDAIPGFPGPRRRARAHPRPGRVGGQPAHLSRRRLPDPHDP